MRALVLCLLLFSASSWSCKHPITLNYGPFVSLLIIDQFFGAFHKELEVQTGCTVEYQLHRDFESFLLSLYNRESMITVVPKPYHNVLKQVDYTVIASQKINKIRNIYVITKRKSPIESLADLTSRKVAVISPLSSSGSYFLEKLDNLKILPQVEIHYGVPYDRMIISVLKNEVDAAVVIEEYWGILDDRIKDNQLKVIAHLKENSSSDFLILKEYESLAPKVVGALKKAPLKWDLPDDTIQGSELLQFLLEEKLRRFKEVKK